MNVTRAERQAVRRQEAETRNAAWAAKSYEQQLAALDSLFGAGKGAAKQRAKIARQISVRDNKNQNNKKKK